MKVLTGFFYSLASAVITLCLYFCLSPIFSQLHILLPTSHNTFFTPALESTYSFVLNSGWVWLILWILISAIMIWFAQIFKREQLREEYLY
jgi:hypothetical protein